MIRAWIVDDEQLAILRLGRMLEETGRVAVMGVSNDPVDALQNIPTANLDVIFLDIQMPGIDGFQLLEALGADPPLIVFTTAHHEHAVRAFEVNAIDYLLKPIESRKLDRALAKLDRIRGGAELRPDLHELVRKLASALPPPQDTYPMRLPSRMGDRIEFVDLARVTHFYAKDKLTFAATASRHYCVDGSIAELETRLDPRRFVRIHRSTMINTDYIQELYSWFGGKMLVRMRDDKKTELSVARDRVRVLKEKLQL